MDTLTRREALATLAALAATASSAGAAAGRDVFPGAHWTTRRPEEVGLDPLRLDALRDLVGGRGCVVRHGCMAYTWGDQARAADVASAVKPVISTLLLIAVQERRLLSVDDRVSRFEPALAGLNGGKDAGITWRHLASQTSGYGLAEPPGKAWAYNDVALALYFDTLIDRVYARPPDVVLASRLDRPLQFEDACTFDALGSAEKRGRLAVSVRDFARFGLLMLRGGAWAGRQLLKPSLAQAALRTVVPARVPRTSGKEAAVLTGQRTMGGGKDQTATGPGLYSFNWWIDGRDREGRRLFRHAPPGTFVASGHGGVRCLWVLPALDMVVSWNDARVTDHDASPADPATACNRAARLMADAAR